MSAKNDYTSFGTVHEALKDRCSSYMRSNNLGNKFPIMPEACAVVSFRDFFFFCRDHKSYWSHTIHNNNTSYILGFVKKTICFLFPLYQLLAEAGQAADSANPGCPFSSGS